MTATESEPVRPRKLDRLARTVVVGSFLTLFLLVIALVSLTHDGNAAASGTAWAAFYAVLPVLAGWVGVVLALAFASAPERSAPDGSRSRDWDIPMLGVAFALAAAVCLAPAFLSRERGPATEATPTRLSEATPTGFGAYHDSIAGAAVKQPFYQRTLAALQPAAGSTTVDVVNFGDSRDLPPKDRTFAVWVALRSELHDACAGAADPVRRLEQLLGLPPGPAPGYVVKEIQVAPDGMFRPCIGAVNEGASPTCTFDLAPPPPPDADLKTMRDAYDQMRFVTNQMFQSYRVDFPRNPPAKGDYPYTGYPFTGMGWTYDWSPSSSDHYGVSEFVIKGSALITTIDKKTPADFCAKAQ